jgi:hypothetical protein
MVWARVSWNVTTDDLNPAVLTLAMLFPTTSIIVWCDLRPEMPANIERIMVWLPPESGAVHGVRRESIRRLQVPCRPSAEQIHH